jgi:hypothetical protein
VLPSDAGRGSSRRKNSFPQIGRPVLLAIRLACKRRLFMLEAIAPVIGSQEPCGPTLTLHVLHQYETVVAIGGQTVKAFLCRVRNHAPRKLPSLRPQLPQRLRGDDSRWSVRRRLCQIENSKPLSRNGRGSPLLKAGGPRRGTVLISQSHSGVSTGAGSCTYIGRTEQAVSRRISSGAACACKPPRWPRRQFYRGLPSPCHAFA